MDAGAPHPYAILGEDNVELDHDTGCVPCRKITEVVLRFVA